MSLSSPLSGLNWDKKRVSNIYPQYYDNLLNLPQNISILWDMEKIRQTIDKIVEFNGMITLMGHYKKDSDDGITKENLIKISEILDYIATKQVWYATLSEIADFWKNAKN